MNSSFEYFVQITSQIRCLNHMHTCHQRNVLWAWRTSVVLSNTYCHTVSSQLSARQCLFWRYLFGERLLQIRQHDLVMLSIESPVVRAWKLWFMHVKNFHWNNFPIGWKFTKFTKLKTHEILVLYGIDTNVYMYVHVAKWPHHNSIYSRNSLQWD